MSNSSTNCRHIKSNGTSCGAPSMRESIFCYFHSDLNRRHEPFHANHQAIAEVPKTLLDEFGQFKDPLTADYFTGAPEPFRLDLPPLEDLESIQIAASVILTAFATNRLDPKRATVLLYGLQVASSNASRIRSSAEPPSPSPQ